MLASVGLRGVDENMLTPDDRTLLVDLLAAPEGGFQLEHAVATTFSLQLTALLPVPLGFAGADLSASADPLSVMQAVRSYADRVDVFCQAGHVTVPQKHNDLLAFLEPMVHQVKAPSPGRLFHPKIWVLRFVDQHGEERYRLICGSRNLTDARSWDAAVSLEGRVTDRVHKFNTPIADFVESLAARVPAGVPKPRRRAIRDLATNLRLVEWEAPIDVFPDWLTFHVFGRSQAPDVNLTGYRRMIVSPYLNDAGLETLWPDGATGECTVVSRDDQLDGLNVEWKDWLL